MSHFGDIGHLVPFIGNVTRYHVNCCNVYQCKFVLGKPFYCKFSSNSHRFRVIVTAKWRFLAAQLRQSGQTSMWSMSDRCTAPLHLAYHTFSRFEDSEYFVRFSRYVTRFHGNRCYGNQGKCILGKFDPKFT